MHSLRSLLLASGLAALLMTATPAQAAAGDSVPVIVPEVAVRDDSIWIGYNVCPVAVLGDPEPCTGPHKLVEIPIGTDPCALYPGLPVLCQAPPQPCDVAPSAPVLCQAPPQPCDVAPTAPVLCGPVPCQVTSAVNFCEGHCKVTNSFDPCGGDCTLGNVDVCEPDVCDMNDDLPFTCGNDECPTLRPVPGFCGTPSLEPCEEAPSAPVLCQAPPQPCDVAPTAPVLCGPVPCQVTSAVNFCEGHCKVTNSFDPCGGDCTLGNVDVCEPDVCDMNDDLPFTCGNDECPTLRPVPGFCGTPQPDFCEDVSDDVPGTCDNELPDPCDPVGSVEPCNPDVWIIVVDGELCFYKQPLLGGGQQELLFCVPV